MSNDPTRAYCHLTPVSQDYASQPASSQPLIRTSAPEVPGLFLIEGVRDVNEHMPCLPCMDSSDAVAEDDTHTD